jgi:hypothetical protein
MEIHGRMGRGSILPTPQAQAEPRARQGAYGRLVGLALVAWLWGLEPCPAGLAERCRGPRHDGLAADWRTWEAPVAPGVLAAPCGHRGAARARVACSGGGIACPWCADGDAAAGRADGARAWAGLAHGAGGRARGARRAGRVAGWERGHGDPEWADAGLHAQRLGGDAALRGGPGGGGREGGAALGHHVRCASVVRANAGRHGRAMRAWPRVAGGPAAETVTTQPGGLVLKPWASRRDRVVPGARETGGAPHVVPDHASTVVDAWCQGAQGRGLGGEGRPRVAGGAQPCARECRGGGVSLRAAGGQRVAVARAGQGMDGNEDAAVVWAPGADEGPLVECEADGEWWAGDPLAHGPHPCRKGVWRVREEAVRSGGGARRLSAHSRGGLSPVEADTGCTCFGRFLLQEGAPRMWYRGVQGQARGRAANA